jgi:hypothetical protein
MSAMWALLVIPIVAQAIAIGVDERLFHRRREMPRWERVGHPLDAATVVACYAWVFVFAPSPAAIAGYGALALFSCLFVTKDEAIHARLATPAEHWLHAVLFLLHPTVLAAVALLWPALRMPAGSAAPAWIGDVAAARAALRVAAVATASFGAFQALYWNVPWRRVTSRLLRQRPGDASGQAPTTPARFRAGLPKTEMR